jgi:hypothetical protein
MENYYTPSMQIKAYFGDCGSMDERVLELE